MLTVGLFAADARPSTAVLAEELGYDSLWAPDHVVLPRPRVDPSPLEPHEPLFDPVVALTHLAAHTEHILLGTGCVILPQRNPVVLAKQLASLDVLSRGRLVVGVGAGYVEPELRAVGVEPAGRGARMDEYLQAMRSLWHDEEPRFHGDHVDFADVDAYPRPVQAPLPVVVGGHSAAALRRAAVHADGWYGWMLGVRAAGALVAALREAEAAAGRRTPLHVAISPPRPVDADSVRAYAELGVDRLIVVPPFGLSPEHVARFVEQQAPDRVGARRAAFTFR